jgi:hypothetical protein
MRSPVGPALIILSLATAVVLVLVLLQTTGLRGDLDRARAEVVTLREQVEGLERGVPMRELSTRLTELENDLREWFVSGSGTSQGDASTPAGGSASTDEVLDRVDDVLARINDLDDRIDEICGRVPVC